MNVTKKQRVIDFIPCMASALVSAVCLLIYFFAFGHGFDLNVIKGIMVPVAAAVVPVVNLIFRIRIPFAFNIAVAAFAVCGLDFASLLNFYHYVPYYDKFLHTAFGIAGAFWDLPRAGKFSSISYTLRRVRICSTGRPIWARSGI